MWRTYVVISDCFHKYFGVLFRRRPIICVIFCRSGYFVEDEVELQIDQVDPRVGSVFNNDRHVGFSYCIIVGVIWLTTAGRVSSVQKVLLTTGRVEFVRLRSGRV